MQFAIQRLTETTSTNDDAKKAAEAGASEGTVFWALRQTAGRGRQGRAWQAPEGNLLFSLILRPTSEIRDWGAYSFIAALAVGEVVQAYAPAAKIELKWPNDVLVNGKKISGILLEAGPGYLVMGIGLNVRHFPDNPLYPTTSLAAENATLPPLNDILDRLLTAIGQWCATFDKEGFAPIRAAWLARARMGPMRVRQPDGDIHGDFAGLDPHGNLQLLLPDGKTCIFSTGDVFF